MENEFIEAYSDDQIYLNMIQELVDSHPVEASVPENIKVSSFCRLWSVTMIGSIESMIKIWNTGDMMWADINEYFTSDRIPNAVRIEKLKSAFKFRGIEVDDSMFQDLVAIKYIRNAYVHSDWKEDQKNFVIQCGFPGDLMHFEGKHFERMKAVYEHVMNNLGMAHALNSVLRAKFR